MNNEPSDKVKQEIQEINSDYSHAKKSLGTWGICFDYLSITQQLSLKEHVRAQYSLMKDTVKRHSIESLSDDWFISSCSSEAINSWLLSETGYTLIQIINRFGADYEGERKMREIIRFAREDSEIVWREE
jgi:hypothetical protein